MAPHDRLVRHYGHYRRLLVGAIAVAASAHSWAGKSEGLQTGHIGKVGLGASLEKVLAHLPGKKTPDFMGEGRVGLALRSRSDLQALALDSYNGDSVSAAELLFVARGKVFRASMLTLTVPCSTVRRLQDRARDGTGQFREVGGTAWSTRASKSAVVWGGQERPVCAVWVRDA